MIQKAIIRPHMFPVKFIMEHAQVKSIEKIYKGDTLAQEWALEEENSTSSIAPKFHFQRFNLANFY